MVAVVLEVALSGAGSQDMPRRDRRPSVEWDVGIEKHIGGTLLVPSSRSPRSSSTISTTSTGATHERHTTLLNTH